MSTNRTARGLLYALVALFSWGIHGPAGRWLALGGVDMNLVAACRLFIGAAVFWVWLLMRGKTGLVKQVPLTGGFFALALIGLVGNTAIYHAALFYIPATLVMILENLSPVFVMLFAFALAGTRPKPWEVAAFLLAMGGLVLIVSGKTSFTNVHPRFYFGVLLGALTGVTFGYYTYFSSVFMKERAGNPDKIIAFLAVIFSVSALFGLPFIFTARHWPQGFGQWFWLIEMGLFQSGLSYIFWMLALTELPVNTASILFLGTVLFTTINELLFLNLQLNLPLVAGGGFILAAGWLLSVKARKKRA